MGLRVTPALALVDRLDHDGVLLVARADRLYFSPADRVSDESRRLLRLHKTEVLKILRAPRVTQDLWPDYLEDLGSRSVDTFDSCSACTRGSWVRYDVTVL